MLRADKRKKIYLDIEESMSDFDDLNKRFKLLVGENKLTVETFSGEIKANKDLINRMMEENKQLRRQVANVAGEASKSRSKEISSLVDLKSRINILTDENKRKEKIVCELQAKIALTERGIVSEDNNPQARQVRVLENRIDKAMIKLNEAQSIKKTYEGILDRLKEERIGFDKTLAELEVQLKAKRKDHDELVLLLRDATHAKELAHAELHRFEQAVMEERNQRDREVMEKRILVQKRIEMNRTLEDNRRSNLVSNSTPSPLPFEPINTSDDSTTESVAVTVAGKEVFMHDHYEEAYRKLKDITGCSDVNEIIQKFVNQDETQKDLERQVAEQQSTLTQLDNDYVSLSRQLEDVKFAGNGMLTNRKQALEDIEKHLNDSTTKLEQNRTRYEKLARIMIDIHSGVNHLVSKLSDIKVDESEPRIPETLELTDETIEEILNLCEVKIQKLTQVCGHISSAGDTSNSNLRQDADVRVRFGRNEVVGVHLDEFENDDENFFALRKASHPVTAHKERMHRPKHTSKFVK